MRRLISIVANINSFNLGYHFKLYIFRAREVLLSKEEWKRSQKLNFEHVSAEIQSSGTAAAIIVALKKSVFEITRNYVNSRKS